jgi:hypothetical protein
MSSESKCAFPALNASNWGQWSDNMEAYLAIKELWEYVDGSTPRPTFANAIAPTAGELKELSEWKRKATHSSGEIWLAIEDGQKVYVKEVKGDPVLIWKKLEDVHLQKCPGTCFNAYDAFFNIRKDDTETLSALIARADEALQDIKAPRPSNFTLDMLDKELLCMTLIQAPPEDYNNFASSLLLLDSFDIDKLQYAFQNEESCLARNVSGTSHALHTMASFACFFCGGPHMENDCPRKKKASEEAKKQEAAEKGKEANKSFKRKQKAKQKAHELSTQEPEAEKSNVAQVEFAGHASALLSSTDRTQWLKS